MQSNEINHYICRVKYIQLIWLAHIYLKAYVKKLLHLGTFYGIEYIMCFCKSNKIPEVSHGREAELARIPMCITKPTNLFQSSSHCLRGFVL